MMHTPDPARERGMTLIELAIVVIVLGILMTLAVTTLFRARMSANEGAAIAALRAINTAQFQYQSSCGNGLYAASLSVLGRPGGGESQAYLVGELGASDAPSQSGYTFAVRDGEGAAPGPNDCNGAPTRTRYYASAAPTDGAGTRAFATNQSGALWQLPGNAPPAEPFAAPAQLVE